MSRASTGCPVWPASSAAHFVDELFCWFENVGKTRYDEQVSQLEHALQTAHHAWRAADSACAVAAALFHDIGHLLLGEDEAQAGFLHRDQGHELVGARWLTRMFPRAVTEPVYFHVRAKRYLCTVDVDYRHRLSAASTRSFALQGGPLSVEELHAIECLPGLEAALKLRRRDDAAKVSGWAVPGLETYRGLVESLLVR